MSVRLSSKARETKLASFPLLIAFLTKVFLIPKKAVFLITVIIERSSKNIKSQNTTARDSSAWRNSKVSYYLGVLNYRYYMSVREHQTQLLDHRQHPPSYEYEVLSQRGCCSFYAIFIQGVADKKKNQSYGIRYNIIINVISCSP